MINELLESVKVHIRNQYEGIFSETQMARHFKDYVELDLSIELLTQVQEIFGPSYGKRLTDLGCGFGSFVLVCRKADIEAVGVDIGEFEIDFARRRLALEMPELDPDSVYLLRDACATQLESQSCDVVTAWNLLEHMSDYEHVVIEANRLLRPGGMFFGVAPNYFAFRQEAHYCVPWMPLLPRRVGRKYLQWLGRRTDFFEQNIYYVTNWGILRTLQKQGFKLIYPALFKMKKLDLIKSPFHRRFVKAMLKLRMNSILKILILAEFWNPFRSGVYFVVRKPK